MRSLDRINEYVDSVCQQIRWKRAHGRVLEELTNHIVDSRDAYMAKGLDENEATLRSIAETGDAVTIGIQFDSIHRPKPQWSMFGATAILLIIGLIIELFVSDEINLMIVFTKLLYAGLGIVVMIGAYFIDFTIIGKYPKLIYFSIILICALSFLFHPIVRGVSFYTQYTALLLPLAFSAIIFATRNKRYFGILLCGLAFAAHAVITLYIPSVSAFLHFAIVGVILLGAAIYKRWFNTKRTYSFLLMLTPVVLLLIIFFLSAPHRLERFAIAINPYIDPKRIGSVGVMVRELLKGAAILGRGNIPNNYAWVATKSNGNAFDAYLIVTLISLFGWAAFAVILGALLIFIVKGFMLCFKQKSSLGFIVSLSIILTFCVQVFSYLACNLGFHLIDPISLPLISHGNTAMVVNLGLIGIMLSVFRSGDIVFDKKVLPTSKQNKIIVWDDGKLIISFKS